MDDDYKMDTGEKVKKLESEIDMLKTEIEGMHQAGETAAADKNEF
jgi:hypothetical protein